MHVTICDAVMRNQRWSNKHSTFVSDKAWCGSSTECVTTQCGLICTIRERKTELAADWRKLNYRSVAYTVIETKSSRSIIVVGFTEQDRDQVRVKRKLRKQQLFGKWRTGDSIIISIVRKKLFRRERWKSKKKTQKTILAFSLSNSCRHWTLPMWFNQTADSKDLARTVNREVMDDEWIWQPKGMETSSLWLQVYTV